MLGINIFDETNNPNNNQEILVCDNVPAYLTFESNLTNIQTKNSQPVFITADYPTIDQKPEPGLKIKHEHCLHIIHDGVPIQTNVTYSVEKLT
jgi:hypothetical protein